MKVALAIFALVAVGSVAQADLRSDIKSANEKIAASLKKQDFAAYDNLTKELCSSDFKCTERGRTKTREQMVQELKFGVSQAHKILASEVNLKSLSQKGSSATSTSSHHLLMVMTGADNQTHKIDYTATSTDIWTKNGKKWTLTSSVFSKDAFTMDGKPLQMGGG